MRSLDPPLRCRGAGVWSPDVSETTSSSVEAAFRNDELSRSTSSMFSPRGPAVPVNGGLSRWYELALRAASLSDDGPGPAWCAKASVMRGMGWCKTPESSAVGLGRLEARLCGSPDATTKAVGQTWAALGARHLAN